jgi:hypothetical protein
VKQIKEILYNRKWRGILLGALFILSLWFIKNFLLTGDPLFPAFAGKLGVFNWNPELEKVILKTSSSLTAAKFFKYMNFFFIWPGINAAKYVILTIAFFPLIIFRYSMKSEIDKSLIFELSFWLGVSLLTVMGICFVAWQDPRAYRYLIGVLSFTAVFSIHFILRYVFNIRKKILLCSVMLILPLMAGANEGYKIIYQAGGGLEVPALRDNIDVILNIAHTDLVIKKHYPNVASILNVINENEGKMAKSAWDINSFDLNFPAFFLPVRPVVSLWASTIIKWDSYSSDSLIVNDLRSFGIEWIMEMREGKLVFLPIEEYAREAARYERYPKTTSFDYGFPEELTRVVY